MGKARIGGGGRPGGLEVNSDGLLQVESLAYMAPYSPLFCRNIGASFTGEAQVANRAGDWLAQAERDLAQAEDSQRAERHEWACFAAHQAAEKAVKALHLHLKEEAWGHVVAVLLHDLPESTPAPSDLIEKGRVLDTFYIPSRYPNSHPEGAPFQHYGPLQSGEALRYAREILGFVRLHMA